MKNSFPIWDQHGISILIDEKTGGELWMDEAEIGQLMRQQKLAVHRPRKNSRVGMKIMLKVAEDAVFPKGVRRLQTAPPLCVRVAVGDTARAYQHVAERCESYYDGRPMPVGLDGKPQNWQLDESRL